MVLATIADSIAYVSRAKCFHEKFSCESRDVAQMLRRKLLQRTATEAHAGRVTAAVAH
jgi:hypothetical protein